MKTRLLLTVLLAGSTILTGCGSLTGFSNAQTDFSCQGKDGEPSCRTISEIFESAAPVSGTATVKSSKEIESSDASGSPAVMTEAASIGTPDAPWRTPEKVLRVWMAPFTDDYGDLHDQRYLFVRVKDAGWREDAVALLAKERQSFKPVYPLKDPNAEQTPKKSSSMNPADILPLLGKGAQ